VPKVYKLIEEHLHVFSSFDWVLPLPCGVKPGTVQTLLSVSEKFSIMAQDLFLNSLGTNKEK
jgi:hypothetical protein